MEIIYLDKNFNAEVVGEKRRGLVSENDILFILEFLGYSNDSIIYADNYVGGEFDKKLGNGCSFDLDCNGVKKRVGIYSNGLLKSVKFIGDTKDYVYSIEFSSGQLELKLNGIHLKFEDGSSISKMQECKNCVYEVRRGDYLLRCSFECDDKLNIVSDELDTVLVDYFKTLKFPLSVKICDIYKAISGLSKLSPALQVMKGESVVTDKVFISPDGKAYAFMQTTGNEVVECDNDNGSSYIKYFSLPQVSSFSNSYRGDGDSSNCIEYMYVKLKDDKMDFGFVSGKNCGSDVRGSYVRDNLSQDMFRGCRTISSFEANVNEILGQHSKLCRKRTKTDEDVG